MTFQRRALALSAALFACGWLDAGRVPAQEHSADSLRLPEVVITGVDESKIRRPIAKTDMLPAALPVMWSSCRDDAEKSLQEGAMVALAQPRKAEKFYQTAIALDPEQSMAFFRLGKAYQASKLYERAAEAYKKAVELSPDFAEAHYALGALYEGHLRDPQQALAQYRAYLKAGGTDARVNIWMREIEEKQQAAQ